MSSRRRSAFTRRRRGRWAPIPPSTYGALAGATVLRGPMGFGESARIHNANILDLSANLPLVIEIVDAEDKLRFDRERLERFAIGNQRRGVTGGGELQAAGAA